MASAASRSTSASASSGGDTSGQKKLLALDGGGIRGMITVEILAGLERMLREETGRKSLVLADYFDYIAGTSTGAIIATCLSLGMDVDTIRRFYIENGTAMFDRAGILRRGHSKYEDDELAKKLQDVLATQAAKHLGKAAAGRNGPTLGSKALRTLLLVVMRNATTDSPWPISSNPAAMFNDAALDDCNLDLPLWQLVRASTAAPTYFPPEEIILGKQEKKRFLFVDGGVTTYNNPAFLLFLMATLPQYRLGWETGREKMLLVSVGTGTSPKAEANLSASGMHLLYNASNIPGALMYAALNEQDLLCRAFGRCLVGDPIDLEVGDMVVPAAGERPGPLPELFTYMRYNAELTPAGLKRLGVGGIDPEHVQKLDSVDYIGELQRVGEAVAKTKIRPSHFKGFV